MSDWSRVRQATERTSRNCQRVKVSNFGGLEPTGFENSEVRGCTVNSTLIQMPKRRIFPLQQFWISS